MDRKPIEQEAFEFLKELSDSIEESRHTPIVLDVYGTAIDMIIARDDRIRAEVRAEALDNVKRHLKHLFEADIIKWDGPFPCGGAMSHELFNKTMEYAILADEPKEAARA